MTEQDRHLSEIVAEQRSRLRNFIGRRVPNAADVEDIVQEVFYELVEANRLLMPIEHVAGWHFQVARNGITDLFPRKKRATYEERESGYGLWILQRDALVRPSTSALRQRHAASC